MAQYNDNRFLDSCSRYADYPTNLISRVSSNAKVKEWQAKLNDPEIRSGLFDARADPCLSFLDIHDGEHDTHAANAKSLDEVKSHLHGTQGPRIGKDPRFRYVSVEAYSSRDPLDCSFEMFAYLCSYHQIPESMLEHVFAFGKTEEPKDVCLTGFQTDDTLLVPSRQKIEVPSAIRPTSEIRVSYLLRVVEKSSSSPDRSWNVRQLAVYHSFDVNSGQAFWMTIKPNGITREAIHDEQNNLTERGVSPDTPSSFADTLRMHLLLLEAICENWRWHLDEVESSLRSIINMAKTVKLDTEPHFDTIPEDIKATVLHRNSIKPVENRESFYKKARRSFSNSWSQKKSSIDEKPPKAGFFGQSKAGDEIEANKMEHERLKKHLVLNLFSFKDVQKLQVIAETIQEGLLAIEMNASVLKDIREYYQHLSTFEAMPANIRHWAATEFACFIRKIERLEADLARKQKQWQSMEKLARDGKTLYDGILQYRNLQVSRIYAESAHSSARKMEKIAVKTEEETASMHIITMVTLVFLPGTFFTSFLQSGIFQWNEPVSEDEASWVFKKDVFGLFAAITFVSMFITFVVWFFMFRFAKVRSRRQLYDVEAGPVEGVEQEKQGGSTA